MKREGSRAACKCSPIFPAFLEMRCKYIHYSVIPLMKTEKHFSKSETYFSINFNTEVQAQGAQCGNWPRSRGPRCSRLLLQDAEVTVATWLLPKRARSIACGLGNTGNPSKPGPKPGVINTAVGKRVGLAIASQARSRNQEALGLNRREEQEVALLCAGKDRVADNGFLLCHLLGGCGSPRLHYTQ